MAESLFATLEGELLARRRFHSQGETRMACFNYVEGFYKPLRWHSALSNRAPLVYEQEARSDPSYQTMFDQDA